MNDTTPRRAMPRLKVTIAHPADPTAGYIGSFAVAGSHVYAAGGTYNQSTMLHSTDAGHTFTRMQPPTSWGLRDIYVDGTTIYVVGAWLGGGGVVARTSDDGATWTMKRFQGQQGQQTCLYVIDREPTSPTTRTTKDGKPGRLWLTGDDGLVMRSRSGTQWKTVPTKTRGRVLQLYFDPRDGAPWLLDAGGELQRWKADGFELVPVKAMRANRPLTRLERTHAGTLLLIGDGGMVLRSTNDGASWKKIVVGTRADLEDMIVTRYGILVVGARGTLLVSNDDGSSWDEIATAMTGHLWSIDVVAGGILIGGEAAALYRIETTEIATLLRDAYAGHDELLAALAARVQDGDPGAEMVLEDALRERGLW